MEGVKKIIRESTHAGSWYESDGKTLLKSFNTWFSQASGKGLKEEGKLLKGIIGPHAGYSYCGETAANAYININPANYNRIFLLGPCHFKSLKGCGLPICSEYETPFGNIQVDLEIVNILSQNKYFKRVTKEEEEQEHSLEMHLPLIKHI